MLSISHEPKWLKSQSLADLTDRLRMVTDVTPADNKLHLQQAPCLSSQKPPPNTAHSLCKSQGWVITRAPVPAPMITPLIKLPSLSKNIHSSEPLLTVMTVCMCVQKIVAFILKALQLKYGFGIGLKWFVNRLYFIKNGQSESASQNSTLKKTRHIFCSLVIFHLRFCVKEILNKATNVHYLHIHFNTM